MPLKGHLGLDTARVPQADRHGLLWPERGRVTVEDGTVVFTTAGNDEPSPDPDDPTLEYLHPDGTAPDP